MQAVGLNAVVLLFMSRKPQASGTAVPPLSTLVGPRKVAPAGREEEQGEEAEADSSSRRALAKSLQAAEALLRRCIQPSLRRLLLLQPSEEGLEGREEEEEAAWPVGGLAQVECGFLRLSRGLSVREDPHTETFQGHVRPEPAQAAFSYHATWSSTARHCATLHALLQQRHHLHLARHYSQRLKAASDFVQRLRTAEGSLLLASKRQEARWGRQLRGLCEELRTHTAHWEALQRHMRSDPWLRPLLLQRQEPVLRMKQAFSLLALQGLCLLEHCLEALLRQLAHPPGLPPAALSDFFQGLDIYNQVVREQPWQHCSVALWTEPGSSSDLQGELGPPAAFPVERVLGLLAAERGQRAACKLSQLLLGLQAEASGAEGSPEAWLPEASLQAGEGGPSLCAELQALGQAEEEHLLRILGELVASTRSLWHHLLSRPKQERPPEGPEASDATPLPAWKAVRWLDASYSEAAGALWAQYRPLFWSTTATALAHQLELRSPPTQSQARTAALMGQQLAWLILASLSLSLLAACLPQESTEELRGSLLHLLVRGVLQRWDRDFCHVLGSSLTDKCVATPSQTTAVASSHTAQLLQSLFPPLASSLRCLNTWFPGSPADRFLGPAGCRSALLSLSVAASQTSCYWVLSKASQHLASGSLSQFLLVTHGDLQLLQGEVSRVAALSSPVPPGRGKKPSPLVSQQEQELSQQVSVMDTSLQHFAKDALRLFSSECKRMAAEILGQTMPLGKHWRLALQADVPSSPSEYASAAAQAVLGQVLQGIQLLPHEAQEPVLGLVTTAFLEAWMEHILAQKIRFSLQGALQLKRDFELVKELLQCEEAGLSAEGRQRVLSLRIFQQADNAIACLLQQPSKTSLLCHPREALCQCCSYNGIHTLGSGPGSLNSLESLEGQPAGAAGGSQAGDLLSRGQGGGSSPETYLSAPQQEWLALRLHGGRHRWKVPGLACMCRTTEP
ncbi:coiled-coil domain-containing protein 142 [Heteronotia binoei]|uniref:coiled-coil domain-containing protein 142 n=1 Tax=Heteronotia binoei TaxID=13085 RepID=UPI002930222F|nr:coiled-coil domain-containing protein 142 [Heteronotia binoei]